MTLAAAAQMLAETFLVAVPEMSRHHFPLCVGLNLSFLHETLKIFLSLSVFPVCFLFFVFLLLLFFGLALNLFPL